MGVKSNGLYGSVQVALKGECIFMKFGMSNNKNFIILYI